MHYDPIKDIFAAIIRKFPFLRVLFFKTLDLMFLRSWYVRRELRRIRGIFFNNHIEILDAGTGYGQYAYFMNKQLKPNNILAVDIKEKWINDSTDFAKSARLKNIKFEVADLLNLNFNNKFDLITCIDVMEHIEDDVKVFSNYYNALKSGGFLLINTPSIYGGSDVHDDHEESFIGEHFRDGYSYEDLSAKLIPLGFTVFAANYTYGFWGDKAWRLGIKYPMIMLNFTKLAFILLPVYYLFTLPFTLVMMYIDFKTVNPVGSGINFIARK